MAEKDRKVLHFLWVSDITQNQPKFIVPRFNRVVFGVSSSAFLLNINNQTACGVCLESVNIKRAPWRGKAFERMVESTKRCLKKMIDQVKISYDSY